MSLEVHATLGREVASDTFISDLIGSIERRSPLQCYVLSRCQIAGHFAQESCLLQTVSAAPCRPSIRCIDPIGSGSTRIEYLARSLRSR